MRGQLCRQRQPGAEQALCVLEARLAGGDAAQGLEPGVAGARLGGQRGEVDVVGAEQGAAQHLGQFEVAVRGVEEAQQGRQVARLSGVQQAAAAAAQVGDAQLGERLLQGLEMGARPRQHHDVAVVDGAPLAAVAHRRTGGDQGLDARRHLAAFAQGPRLLFDLARCAQRVAQAVFTGYGGLDGQRFH